MFLCVHNAGRSQMAAGWLEHLAGDQVEVFSGGSNPGTEVNPSALAVMAKAGIDITRAYPKARTEDILRAADVIITMGCGDACPIFPGKHYEDWELPDPAASPHRRSAPHPRRDRRPCPQAHRRARPHRAMAVMMSQQLLNQPLAQHTEVTQLATAIRDGQHAEIATMMGWLGSWFTEGMHGQR